MVHLHEMPEGPRNLIVDQDLPKYPETKCKSGPKLEDRRIAIVTTAGLHRRKDTHFSPGKAEYRIIPSNTDMEDLIMSHISTNFDRTGFYRDVNVVLPHDRLVELVKRGEVGQEAEFHYSFMGATPPSALEPAANELVSVLKDDNVTGVIFSPV